jgi:isopenicillin N synthase-like dioxygenase
MTQEELFTKIPVIDFVHFLNGSTGDQQRVADEIGHAGRNVGFFYLSNHEVPQDLLDRVFGQARRLFAMPVEDKMKIQKIGPHFVNGYTLLLKERVCQ